MAPVVIFEGSNVKTMKVYEAEDTISGIHFILNLRQDGSVYFKVFSSRHALRTYSPPPTLQITANSNDGPAAVDVKSFHAFFTENIELLRDIQKGSTFKYNEANNQNERMLSAKARDAEEFLTDSFECFVGELEWVDGSVTIEDIEYVWTDQALAEVIVAGMSEDEAVEAVRNSQAELSNIHNVIVGDPELMALDFYYRNYG